MTPPADLQIALHGPTAACHEQHAAPGSFAAAMGALAGARARGQRVVVTSWITRSTCRSLLGLGDRLVGYGAAGWVLAWPWVDEPTAPAVARTIPRLGIAVPHALRAVERATARGLVVAVVGMPSCALGPFAAHALAAARGSYPAACEGCPARAGCPGIDPWYLSRFGAEELHAVAAVPRIGWPEPLARRLAAAATERPSLA